MKRWNNANLITENLIGLGCSPFREQNCDQAALEVEHHSREIEEDRENIRFPVNRIDNYSPNFTIG